MQTCQISFILSSFLFLTLAFSSCTTESITYDCTSIAPTYNDHIKSIMDVQCAYSGCHDAVSKEDGIDLSTYATVSGESSRARFMGSMHHEGSYNRMPEGEPKLSTSNLQKIYCWIQNGTPEQ